MRVVSKIIPIFVAYKTKNGICQKYFLTEKQGIMITRIIAIIVGLLAIVCALWIQSVLVALDVAYAFISGCVFVPLVFAFLLK